MKELRIISIEHDFIYVVEDDEENEYELNLEFQGEEKADMGDTIVMDERLLDSQYEGYCGSYTFGNMESPYGRSGLEEGSPDVIRVVKPDKEILLKRLYG